MMTIVRTIIELPPRQIKALEKLCQEQGISRAEAIRQAVDKLIEQQQLAASHAAFGAWRHKRIDSRKIVDRLRSEWSA